MRITLISKCRPVIEIRFIRLEGEDKFNELCMNLGEILLLLCFIYLHLVLLDRTVKKKLEYKEKLVKYYHFN